jgi:hypothetical protein
VDPLISAPLLFPISRRCVTTSSGSQLDPIEHRLQAQLDPTEIPFCDRLSSSSILTIDQNNLSLRLRYARLGRPSYSRKMPRLASSRPLSPSDQLRNEAQAPARKRERRSTWLSHFSPPLLADRPAERASTSRRRRREPSQSHTAYAQKRPRRDIEDLELPSPIINREKQGIPLEIPPRPSSATTILSSSSAQSISQYYGVGDDHALDNLFSCYPHTFSTISRPIGAQGLDLPAVEMQPHEIHLQRSFPRRSQRLQQIQASIPAAERDPPITTSPPQLAQGLPNITRAQFESALAVVREVIGHERRITRELLRAHERVRQFRERFSWSPLDSDQYESPPPYSPPRSLPNQESPLPWSSTEPSRSPSPVTIPNPPIPGEPFPSIDALVQSVRSFAQGYGFGVTKYNGYSYGGRLIRYSLRCDLFGEPAPTQGAGLRNRRSRKCGCKWMVIAEAIEEGKWLLRSHPKPEHHQHNHGPSTDLSAHPSNRRLTIPIRETIESTSRRIGIRARDVRAVVADRHPEVPFTQRDIYNARARINRENLRGYSPTAALIKLFDEQEIPYVIKWADEEPNRLLGLVWTFPYCLKMWRRFPEIISFDNTYKTNRFKLPLFQATGQTCLGTVFNAAFGLIDNERREGFQFLAESIRQLVTDHSVREPIVIITDFDKYMKAAFDDQFPRSQQQLCIHHINSNVLLQSKRKWVNRAPNGSSSESDEDVPTNPNAELNTEDQQLIQAPSSTKIPHSYEGVLQMWKVVLFAPTEIDHQAAWTALCKEFNDQRAILRYLYGTYLPVRVQWAQCFIRSYSNYGIRVTSGTEASNNNIKSYLLNGTSQLFRLVEAMQDMLQDQEKDFRQKCAADEILTSRDFTGPSAEYLGELPRCISSKALGLIRQEYRIARKAMPSGRVPNPRPLQPCDNYCTASIQFGIPCCHTIATKLIDSARFTKYDIHPRWWLREPHSGDPYRRILDPKIATSLRGRPKNTPQNVPHTLRFDLGSQEQSSSSSQASQKGHARRGRPRGSRNKSTLARLEQKESNPPKSMRQTRSQRGTLGAGRTTGVQASGRRLRPSIRRDRSQWEGNS